MKKLILPVVSLAAGICIGHRCSAIRDNEPEVPPVSAVIDTFTVVDTIHYLLPTVRNEIALGSRIISLPVYSAGDKPADASGSPSLKLTPGDKPADAGTTPPLSHDSAAVEIPITQREYEGEGYRAWVSGYDPRLDSLRVYAPTTIITKREWKPPKKWHIGPTIGYGYTPHGFEPYIGVSITYSILSF